MLFYLVVTTLFMKYAECSSVSDQTTAIGLNGIEGRIAAYGDFNSDQATDVFVLSKDCKSFLDIYYY